MNRRSFLALASGLLAPVPEPVKRYFFAPAGGWATDGGTWVIHYPKAQGTILIDGAEYGCNDVEVTLGGLRFPAWEPKIWNSLREMREDLG